MIGGGEGAFIGAVHRLAARMDNQAELVCASFSRDHENTVRTGIGLGLNISRLYSSYDEMFSVEAALPEDERMQFVVIVTPNHLHVPVAIAALKQGFHVLCDKPAALNYAETVELQNTITETGLLYGLTHTYLGYPMVRQAKHLVETGTIGKIRRIIVEYPQGWLSSAEETAESKQAEWRTNPATSGIAGCLLDIGTHASTLAEYISGQTIIEVCADVSAVVPNRNLDDDASVLFRTSNGTRGTLIASQICAGEENGLKIRIYGEDGGLEWHQLSPNSLKIMRQGQPISIQRAGAENTYLCDDARTSCRTPSGHPECYLEAFANTYQDFIRNAHSWPTKAVGYDRISINTGAGAMAFVEAAVANSKSEIKWTAVERPCQQ
ncbi:MAG: Gfo/Idh/MocA family protein [Kordiimonas sp.]